MTIPLNIAGRQMPAVQVGGRMAATPLAANVLSASPAAGVLTVMDSLDILVYGSVNWALQATKTVNRWSGNVSAAHDGTTSVFVESETTLAPGAGTYDWVYTVDISAGLMRLTVTPVTLGWTFRVIRMEAMPI